MASVASGLGGVGPSFGAVGTDLGDSLAGGLNSTQDANESAGAAAATAGVDGATGSDGSDSHSPSQKMWQVGIYMGQGLIGGQKSMIGGSSDAGAALGSAGVGAAANAVSTFDYNNTLAGGFGAGIVAASNGVMPIAQDYGLMLGYSWAENVVTGAENVFESSQFQQVSAPEFGSALAQRNLGLQDLLPSAGRGAEVYHTTAGSAGHVTMPAPEYDPPINVTVDGSGPMKVIVQNVVDNSNQRILDTCAGGHR
jgi:hypothetical protein